MALQWSTCLACTRPRVPSLALQQANKNPRTFHSSVEARVLLTAETHSQNHTDMGMPGETEELICVLNTEEIDAGQAGG